jgi:hypothetical protein
MNKTLENNNYIFIDNFITKKEAEDLYKQFKKDIKSHPNEFKKDTQCPKSFSIYNYRPFLELLTNKTSYISELIGEPVLPTYTYARLYQKGEVLAKHKDRPSCEISVTLNIGGDKDWEIFFTKPNKEQVSVNINQSQAALYLGCESEHWREAFKGKEYAQVFLHYVRSNGPNWIHCFDRINQN